LEQKEAKRKEKKQRRTEHNKKKKISNFVAFNLVYKALISR
jgi:hypothetical protein